MSINFSQIRFICKGTSPIYFGDVPSVKIRGAIAHQMASFFPESEIYKIFDGDDSKNYRIVASNVPNHINNNEDFFFDFYSWDKNVNNIMSIIASVELLSSIGNINSGTFCIERIEQKKLDDFQLLKVNNVWHDKIYSNSFTGNSKKNISSIYFMTPTLIKHERHYIESFSMWSFMFSIVNRMKRIDESLIFSELQMKQIKDFCQITKFIDNTKFCKFNQEKNIGGLQGAVNFSVPINDDIFCEIISFGEIFGVGQNLVKGMGYYKIFR